MKKKFAQSSIFVLMILLLGTGCQAQSSQPDDIFRALTSGFSAPQKFDGHLLYADAFAKLMDYHILLIDKNSQFVKDWAAQWQHKHDKDGMLDTEDGADAAVLEMMESLGQRFDYYYLPGAVAREHERQDPKVVGIGAIVYLSGLENFVKAEVAKLPKNATHLQKQIAGMHIDEATQKLTVGPGYAVEVVEPVPGGPAEKGGLLKGDHIVAVGGVPVNGLTLKQVVGKLRGPESTSVDVTVERADAAGKYAPVPPVTIVRKPYVTPDVHTKDLGNGIGYIKLDDFDSEYSVKEMTDALKADASGKFVILDLRDNPGGYTDNGIAMAELFLRDGIILERHQRKGDEIITRREELEPEFEQEITISSKKPNAVDVGEPEERNDEVLPDDMPIVVLVNENTYSCAEILSGTLQFNHRAVVVGEPTGGKGVEQTLVGLVFGREFHVTSAEFMPAGMPHRTDWIGVIPDFIVEQPKPDADAKTDSRAKPGAKPDASAKPATEPVDAQLEAAKKIGLELVAERDARKKQADTLKQKHEDDFKKQQQE
jgi:C-terminal peptidase prc